MHGVADTDVVVVGYGPVGQVTAALPGLRGHRVTVLEQHLSRYGLPRAAHLDGEAMRILQGIGAADAVAAASWTQTGYEFLTRRREPIHRIDFDHLDPSGWAAGYFCHGPHVETVVDGLVQAMDTVDVRMGARVTDIRMSADRPQVILADGHTIDAAWVVGADGANSIVRRAADIDVEDLGYSADWLVVDVHLTDPDLVIDMPEAAQICDPTRPVSVFRRLGREHLRVEFPTLPDDHWTTAAVWAALHEWGLGEADGTIVRQAVYTFRSQLADAFRSDRVLLAGDAAHLMPPFLGQGLCSGLRDAAALAWRLDHVLTGQSTPAVMDTYGQERRPHVRTLIEASTVVGRIIGADRPAPDIAAALSTLPTGPAALENGLLDPCNRVGSGTVAPQPVVTFERTTARADDLTPGRWTLLLRGPDRPETTAFADLDIAVQTMSGEGPTRIDEPTHTYRAWLASMNAAAVLIRPDHYVHTALPDDTELPTLAATLRDQLTVAGAHR